MIATTCAGRFGGLDYFVSILRAKTPQLETERQIRAKLENSRNLLNQELEELSDKLKEAHGSTDIQAAVVRRKEQEMLKLRRDMNEEHKVIENQMETAKRNFQKSFAEISEKLQNSENVNHR